MDLRPYGPTAIIYKPAAATDAIAVKIIRNTDSGPSECLRPD
jgi:hypothetical protein